MYETLQLNGHKIDPKDDVRRDDMHEAAIEFARNISLGKVCNTWLATQANSNLCVRYSPSQRGQFAACTVSKDETKSESAMHPEATTFVATLGVELLSILCSLCSLN